MASFESLEEMLVAASDSVRPPERLTVSEASEKYRKLNNKGAYVGPWKNDMAKYLVDPMNILTSTKFVGMIFVAPAQSGKTEVYLNWHTYTVVCDPADMMLIEASQARASDFSKRRIDRLHRDTPIVAEKLIPGRNHDNTFDKRYRSGSLVTLSWPTVNELSGKPIPRLFLTDYDRMPLDVGSEGVPFDLAMARATTFRRYGMTVAESSPSYPILDPRWTPSSAHEAPPTQGILSLYNRGDRRRWYWQCIDCSFWFEPDFKLLTWADAPTRKEVIESIRLACPHCGSLYKHDPEDGRPGKHQFNQKGRWLIDGQRIAPSGEITGEARVSKIASFWLKGAAAAFKDWTTLVSKYLDAETEFANTQDETALKTTINVDQGLPYLPKTMEAERLPEELKERSEDLGYKVVPAQVRFLVASIDVQKNRFVVQVHGISEGNDLWVIDRFDIRHSLRADDDREGQFHYVRPFTYKEDWKLILKEVILKKYPLADGSDRHMRIKSIISDSGGMNEATANAYYFWRWLKTGPSEVEEDRDYWEEYWEPNLHRRFWLYKGEAGTGPRTRITFPDSGRKDRFAGARGEIPVVLANVTPIKNQLDAILDRERKNTGKMHFAHWLDLNFYKELCVEVKDPKGVWQNPKRFRNESWDLLVMTMAALIERRVVGAEYISWDDPPDYACNWDDNPLVTGTKTGQNFAKKSTNDYDLSQLAKKLG